MKLKLEQCGGVLLEQASPAKDGIVSNCLALRVAQHATGVINDDAVACVAYADEIACYRSAFTLASARREA